MKTKKYHIESGKLRELYAALLKPRLIEERMLLLLRQGKVSKWFSGIGQEAIAVGATLALKPDEYILPLHRNLGVFTTRNIPLGRLVRQWQGSQDGFSKGRERSFHFGTNEFHIVGMISHLGPQLCVADGIALAEKIKGSGRVALVFSGEGGTSEGDFHEALNVASVWDLPVIFLVENNGYALSTPIEEQFRCEKLIDRAKGYGMEGLRIDGNNLVEVYETIDRLATSIRKKPRPVLVECMTFRMRGHEEASGTKYVPKELFAEWAKKDPVQNFEDFLVKQKIYSSSEIKDLRAKMIAEIAAEIEAALVEPIMEVDSAVELGDVYAPSNSIIVEPTQSVKKNRRFVDAISDGLRLALGKNPDLILMGQDIAKYGGVFKVTEGLAEEFGLERVRNTPLCESAILGAALGLSIRGIPSIVEMQFADFVTCGFNQIVNNLAKSHYRWGQNAAVVVRMPTGAGSGAGPFHSQSNEGWFFKTPGLKIAFPATPYDVKGMLLASIEDPNPVIFFEHKVLYRSVQEEIPEDYYTVPLGQACLRSQGEQVSVITYGMGVHWALEYLKTHPEVSADVVDLRSLCPLDMDTVRTSVIKTGRVMVLHEDTFTGGVGAEIAARISEEYFEFLDAPVSRVASLDTPVPFAGALEKNFLAKARLEQGMRRLLEY